MCQELKAREKRVQSNSTARRISKRKESVRHALVQEHSQPKVETTQTSIDWQMDTQDVTDPHSGTFNHKNE